MRRRRNNRQPRRNHASRAPTHTQGPTAQGALVSRAPLFGRASVRRKLPYYAYQLTRTTTAGAIGTYFFTANGLFDPDITGTGHQPLGFDTMMLYYEQYTVLSSKISVTFLNNGANAIRAAVSLKPDTTAPVIGDMVENGFVKMVALDSPGYMTGAGAGIRIKQVSLDCDVAAYFGRRTAREMLNDTSLQGTVAANPSEQVYFAISVWGGFFADNIACAFDVALQYDVIFWEPRQVSQMLSKTISQTLRSEEKAAVKR
jgi:hypothetical protein